MKWYLMLQFYSTNIINVKRFINIENNNKDALDENEKNMYRLWITCVGKS